MDLDNFANRRFLYQFLLQGWKRNLIRTDCFTWINGQELYQRLLKGICVLKRVEILIKWRVGPPRVLTLPRGSFTQVLDLQKSIRIRLRNMCPQVRGLSIKCVFNCACWSMHFNPLYMKLGWKGGERFPDASYPWPPRKLGKMWGVTITPSFFATRPRIRLSIEDQPSQG